MQGSQSSTWQEWFGIECCSCRSRSSQDQECGVVPADVDTVDESAFFDCIDSGGDYDSSSIPYVLEPSRLSSNSRDCGTVDLAAARAVLERTREQWIQCAANIGFVSTARSGKPNPISKAVGRDPELEWLTLGTSRRMLRAMKGDIEKAVDLFAQALECRARDRTLYQSMQFQALTDMRITGQDTGGRPAVFMSASSQTEPLKAIRDQLIVTFEAACKMASDDGRIVLIVDMHGFQPQLNMDSKTIRELGTVFGTVFADCIHRIIIVDFSRAAQMLWWIMKPMLQPTTQDKFKFVSKLEAGHLLSHDFDATTCNTICHTLDVNRDPTCSAAERASHARRTNLCEVNFRDAHDVAKPRG